MQFVRQIVFFCTIVLPLSTSPPLRRPQISGVALVRLRVSNIDASRSFYHNTLGLYPLTQGCFSPLGVATCYHLNSAQQIEIFPSPGSTESNAVETMGFLADAVAMRSYLLGVGVKCSQVMDGNSGFKFVETSDPEGHRILFISSRNMGASLSGYPGDSHLIHAGFVVHDRAAEDRFYKDILGFHVYWHGGMKDDETNWVDMQVPDGTDWIEYMLNVPANADHHTLGVMNHIALGVPDIHAAQQQLIKNGWKGTEQPKIGRDGKWQLNLYDPDDTRVELMEFTPVEKPCCSEYTGPHPKQ
ncbi:MAG TPA: VOC family protein [Candidatus Acidoferrales bacterium]|nr:VOC family protein [Candidatus Acidoferrales bacterium]